MIIYKRFNYRIQPNESTITRFYQWSSALKHLWNLANEQRLNGYSSPNGEKVYPSFFSQVRELTFLRKEASWINDVPRHVAVQVLENLDKAWKRCFKGISKQPKWKKKSDYLSFTEFDHNAFSIRANKLNFPKLPPIKIIQHRPLEGKPKSCTIKRDGDQWFASILCEIEIPDPAPRTEPKVGIDRGVNNLIADSNRRLLPNPKFLDKQLKRLARAQKTVSRRKKGSKNREKAKRRVAKIHQTIRRQRDHLLHVESSRYAKSHGIVGLEDLNTACMKRGYLGRQIMDSGWSKFGQYLEYKLLWSGGQLIKVGPKYKLVQSVVMLTGTHELETNSNARVAATKIMLT
jgi:putative transposase